MVVSARESQATPVGKAAPSRSIRTIALSTSTAIRPSVAGDRSRMSTMSSVSAASAPAQAGSPAKRSTGGSTSAKPTARGSASPTKMESRSPKKKSTATFKSSHGDAFGKVVVPFPSGNAEMWDGAEPIKAFLRLRPALEAGKTSADPYILVENDTDILMKPPQDMASGQSAPRLRQAQHYSFSKIFKQSEDIPAAESQATFFQETCLPMISDVLNENQSGLYCTYGVTNSGKSYTIQGSNRAGESGVLPRTLDTIFNSLDGLLSESSIRPVGLSGVEHVEPDCGAGSSDGSDRLDPLSVAPLRKRLLSDATIEEEDYQKEETVIKVDRNYRYSVWISYLEVYNEKLYDLLDVRVPSAAASNGMTRSESIRGGGSNWSLAVANNGGMTSTASHTTFLTRHALPLKNDSESAGDPEGQCKYAAGLSEHQVRSAEEARAIIKRGEQNRAVFGTMANRVSSRSHGVFTVRIIREHGGDEAMFSTSRMSIVDLAGSERMANTQLTDAARMKEAGSINKSLMNLGHCLEKLKSNQSKAHASVPSYGKQASGPMMLPGRPEVVPFNSSKLTALLKPYFVGEGKTVMIITANPYDGGFYENAHVMKFSATAKDVQLVKNAPSALRAAIPRSPTKLALPEATRAPATKASQVQRISAVSSDAGDVTIIEESDPEEEEDQDPLVDLLIAKCEELRQRLFASEKRCADIEAEVRQEMADEMEKRVAQMTEMFAKRLTDEEEMNEDFVNRRLDLLNNLRSNLEATTADDSIADSSITSSVISSAYVTDGDEDVSLVSAMDIIALVSSPQPTPLAHKSAVAALMNGEDDDDSMSVNDSPMLKAGRLPSSDGASRAQSSRQGSSDDTPAEFVSLDSSAHQRSNSAFSDTSEEGHATEQGSDAGTSRDSDASKDEVEVATTESESETASESEPSLVEVSDDSSFDVTEADDDVESSYEVKAPRKSRAPMARASAAARQSAGTTANKTPRASRAVVKGAPRTLEAPETVKKTRVSAAKTPSTSRQSGSVLADSSLQSINRPIPAKILESIDGESDVSMFAPPPKSASPKKKRKLRSKSGVDQHAMMEQIGDSSLTEALNH